MEEKYSGLGLSASELLKIKDFWKNEKGDDIRKTCNPEVLEKQIKLKVEETLTINDFIIDEPGVGFINDIYPGRFGSVEGIRNYFNEWNEHGVIKTVENLSPEDIITLKFFAQRATYIINQVGMFNMTDSD